MHHYRGKTLARCLKERTDYAQNPEKTAKGKLVTAYECDPMTCDADTVAGVLDSQRCSVKAAGHIAQK